MIQSARPVALTSASVVNASERLVYRNIRRARLACREFGVPGNPVCVGIHGLSASSLSFCDVGEALAKAGYHVIVPDLRGRNLSAQYPSSGWPEHERDVVALADAVGAKQFSVVGHSMGAFIAMGVARRAGPRLDKVVCIDALGYSEIGAMQTISHSVGRLGEVYASADAFIKNITDKGTISPWTKTWERHFREELETVPGGVRSRTSASSVLTDTTYAITQSFNPFGFTGYWRNLPKNSMIVRAGAPLSRYFGNVITDLDATAFRLLRPEIAFKTVPANHYTATTEPVSVRTIIDFMRR